MSKCRPELVQAIRADQGVWLGLEHYSKPFLPRRFDQDIDWSGLGDIELKELASDFAEYGEADDSQADLIPHIYFTVHDKTTEIEYLHRAIKYQKRLLESPRHCEMEARHNLVCFQVRRFETTGSIEDLRAAIESAQEVESRTPTMQSDDRSRVDDLGKLLAYKAKKTEGASETTARAPEPTEALRNLAADEKIMEPFFEGDYDPILQRLKTDLSTERPETEWLQLVDTCGLTQILLSGQDQSTNDRDIVGALELVRSQFRAAGEQPRHWYLVCLAIGFGHSSYLAHGKDIKSVERAVPIVRGMVYDADYVYETIAELIDSHPFMAALKVRWGEKINKLQNAVRDLTENITYSRLECQGLLGSLLQQRYIAGGDPRDLYEAVSLLEKRWVEDTQTLESGVLLVNCYVCLFKMPAEDDDDKLSALLRKTEDLIDDLLSHPVEPRLRVQLLAFRCKCYEVQWCQTGDFGLLEDSIELAESLRAQVPYDKGEGPALLGMLIKLYLARSVLHEGSLDIGKALDLATEVLDIADSLNSRVELTRDDVLVSQVGALDEIACCLMRLYELNPDGNFLQEAMKLSTKAVELSRHLDREGPHQVHIHRTLADLHLRLFVRNNDGKKLTQCIEWCRAAIDDSRDRPGLQESLRGSLAHYLANRYASNKEEYNNDLVESKDLARKVLNGLEQSNLLLYIYSKTDEMDLLDEVIRLARDALPESKKRRNTMRFYGMKFGQNPADLVDAEFLLARAIVRRIEVRGEKWSEDAELALQCLLQCSRMTSQSIMVTVKSAILLASPIFISEAKVEMTDLAFATEKAIHLLPSYSSRALKREDIKHLLSSFAGLPAVAAAAAIETGCEPVKALKLLEAGRGILTTYLLDTRQDVWGIDDGADIDLVGKLRRLLAEIETVHASQGVNKVDSSRIYAVDKAYKLNMEVKDILEQLSSQSNPVSLGLPNVKEMQAAGHRTGNSAVVVINVHFRCDAILLRDNTTETLHLPRMDSKSAKKATQCLKLVQKHFLPEHIRSHIWTNVLEWLWDTAVEPILDRLGYKSTPSQPEDWPRVWWIPTGDASQLPFHAAGIHKKDSASSALDRVVSSYSSSVKALLYTQHLAFDRKKVIGDRRTRTREKDHTKVVLVSMSETPAQKPLSFVSQEIREVVDSVGRSSATIAELKNPVKEDVLKGLKSCDVFHFAGHGASYTEDPDSSCLLVNDWEKNPLTVKDVLSLKLYQQAPSLAYLSACSTGANSTDALADEGIHLVTAFQLAGFQHVIGSLWAVSDSFSSEVAKNVYAGVNGYFDSDTDVALALHFAVRKLRESSHRVRSRSDSVVGAETEQDSELEPDLVGNNRMRELGIDALLTELRNSRDPRPDSVQRPRARKSAMRDPVLWAPYFHTGY